MAIVFDCPHCKTNYRLKDEFAGKTATCKNPNCRKVIPIPQPTAASAAKNVDIDALAAAAFSDEPVQGPAVLEEMIRVTCSGCDHVWSVEASKEGKNVLCPECRRPNRVPMRKKVEKVDWRTGADGRPSGAKRETGMDVEGAFDARAVGAIGQQTAAKIVRERDAEEEPEVRRKRWIKRIVIGLVLIGGLSAAAYFGMKKRGEAKLEGKMEDAVVEYMGKDKKERKNGPMFSLIHRASGEYRIKSAKNKGDADGAMNDFKLAHSSVAPNTFAAKTAPTVEQNAVLAAVAVSLADMLTANAELESGDRPSADAVANEIRQTLSGISDPEITADAMRTIARKLADKGLASIADPIVRNIGPELRGQVALELLRIDREKHRPEVDKLLGSIQAGSEAGAPSIQTLRLVFPKPTKKDAKETETASAPQVSYAEKAALAGDIAGVKAAATSARNTNDRVQALVAAAHVLSETNPTESANLAVDAATVYASDPTMPISPWVPVRICRLLAKAGRFDPAEKLAEKIPATDARPWAHLEILRGKLVQPNAKADSTWLTPLGNAEAVAAAAKGHEELARHKALNGEEFQSIVKTWKKGTVQPFGTAGLVLGEQDRKTNK